MTGPRGRLRQSQLARLFAIKGFPSDLAARIAGELSRYRSSVRRSPWQAGSDGDLGHADLLLATVRARIARERDRALAAAARARHDAELRGAAP